ncbi:hypothetical protein M9H77_07588 [Catharanthus roseus]|uniref:Uncharacterized protein n=1 Tax=Catharanthus roseus TaxID=4058 RepID=A0ACC0BVN2_CATRO|nr:hypothetical protein M9H77_07588 [Catharanthus roseus]
MISYKEDALKSKVDEFQDQGKHFKLFTMCSIITEQLRAQLVMGIWLSVSKNTSYADNRATLSIADRLLFSIGVTNKSSIEVLHEESFLTFFLLLNDKDGVVVRHLKPKSTGEHSAMNARVPDRMGLIHPISFRA